MKNVGWYIYINNIYLPVFPPDRHSQIQNKMFFWALEKNDMASLCYETTFKGLIIQHTKLQTHTNVSAPTASHVATEPECIVRGIVNIPMMSLQPCGPGRCRDEVGAKIDCKRWIIQPSPPPFEWVSSVTFRRAFIAKQEKIIFHRPPWRPWTPLINETNLLQPRHTFTHTHTQSLTCSRYEDLTAACMHWPASKAYRPARDYTKRRMKWAWNR